MIKILFVALLAAVGAGLSVTPALPDGPDPNTECGSSGEVVLPGGAALSGTGADNGEATVNALLAASGIVCEICPDGLQCERTWNASSHGSATGTFSQNDDGTVTFTGTVNPGGYVVKADCDAC